MTSGWFIDDIELTMDPISDNRTIGRNVQQEVVQDFFPQVQSNASANYDYKMSGYLFPTYVALELEQLARNAEGGIVNVKAPEHELNFINGSYIIKNLTIDRKGPLKALWNGIMVDAQSFSLTLTTIPDEGELQNELDGTTDSDEEGIGLGQFGDLIDPSLQTEPFDNFQVFDDRTWLL